MPRLFLGTYLSKNDQLALGKLPELNHHLDAAWNCRLKWVEQSKLHLTWIFFGNVEENKINNLCQAIDEIIIGNSPRFNGQPEGISLTYDNLECWLARKIPRLLVLAPSKADPGLLDFADRLRNHLSPYSGADAQQEVNKSFNPHITLIRVAALKEGKPSLPFKSAVPESLPPTDNDISTNLRHNKNSKEMPPSTVNGLTEMLPLTHRLNSISLIQSNEEHGLHQYHILKDFRLFDQ